MRKFIRHPTCIPIEIAVCDSTTTADSEITLIDQDTVVQDAPYQVDSARSEPDPAHMATMVNISAGGLASFPLRPRIGFHNCG